jgi:hypothetical protein
VFVKAKGYSKDEIDRFRVLQQTCFQIQEELGAELREGVTEKEVAAELFQRYQKAGAGNFFHLPVALFGERTGLPGRWGIGKFYPRDVKLREGDAVILDGAPLFDGFMVDTSYSFALGANPKHDDMMRSLLEQRPRVVDEVNRKLSFKAIAERVAADCEALGYAPVHEKHPGEVFGHRAVRVRGPQGWRLRGSDGVSLSWFLLKSGQAKYLPKQSPLWNRNPSSDHPPTDGLWLVEPHFSCAEFGAKWEEILVIEEGRAHWLENDPPHVRRWASARSPR